MKKIRLGILGTSEIAYRRFLPALKHCDEIEYVGVASRNIEKTRKFIDTFGGKGFAGYEQIINDTSIDAVYIPLPPALHYEFGKQVLLHGKHVLMEKPFSIDIKQTNALIDIAREKGLAVHENYMFIFHKQIEDIKTIIKNGEIGDIRLYRIAFGFPKRKTDDFRYSKQLGGGALLDCGGYVLKLAALLVGENVRLNSCSSGYMPEYEVDMYGSASLYNDAGQIAQVAFGMDNSYKCELEIWGSTGSLYTNRILTAPAGYVPSAVITRSDGKKEQIALSEDDSFVHSIEYFVKCINSKQVANEEYDSIIKQAQLVNKFMEGNKNGKF